jgi:hypothetical protein
MVAVTEWELNPKQSPGIRLLICQRLFYDIPSGIEEIAASFDFIFKVSASSLLARTGFYFFLTGIREIASPFKILIQASTS